jgi:hypothetical protein
MVKVNEENHNITPFYLSRIPDLESHEMNHRDDEQPSILHLDLAFLRYSAHYNGQSEHFFIICCTDNTTTQDRASSAPQSTCYVSSSP